MGSRWRKFSYKNQAVLRRLATLSWNRWGRSTRYPGGFHDYLLDRDSDTSRFDSDCSVTCARTDSRCCSSGSAEQPDEDSNREWITTVGICLYCFCEIENEWNVICNLHTNFGIMRQKVTFTKYDFNFVSSLLSSSFCNLSNFVMYFLGSTDGCFSEWSSIFSNQKPSMLQPKTMWPRCSTDVDSEGHVRHSGRRYLRQTHWRKFIGFFFFA